jgi:hypothetical protein
LKVRKSRGECKASVNNWLMIKLNDCFNLLEMLAGLFTSFSKVLVNEDNARRKDTEESSKSEHNKVSNTDREGGLASEHRFLPPVPIEGGQLDCHLVS